MISHHGAHNNLEVKQNRVLLYRAARHNGTNLGQDALVGCLVEELNNLRGIQRQLHKFLQGIDVHLAPSLIYLAAIEGYSIEHRSMSWRRIHEVP